MLRGHPDEAFYTLALVTGARRGELLGLRWGDIDLDARTLRIAGALLRYGGKQQIASTKTETERTISIPVEVCDLLRSYKAPQAEARLKIGPLWQGDQWGAGGLVFAHDDGSPQNEGRYTKTFKRLLVMAGIDRDLHLHNSRHTAATLIYAETGDLKVVQHRLGHSTIATTSRFYAGVPAEVDRDASDGLGRALFGSR